MRDAHPRIRASAHPHTHNHFWYSVEFELGLNVINLSQLNILSWWFRPHSNELGPKYDYNIWTFSGYFFFVLRRFFFRLWVFSYTRCGIEMTKTEYSSRNIHMRQFHAPWKKSSKCNKFYEAFEYEFCAKIYMRWQLPWVCGGLASKTNRQTER